MIYYPLSVLMLAGIKEILIISTEKDLPLFRELLGNGNHLGLSISYSIQKEPRGIAEAFIIGEKFIGNDSVCLILGDNILYGQGLTPILREAKMLKTGALIFGYYVKNPSEYGVVEFDNSRKVLSIEEKPAHPKSNYAVPGIYFYDSQIIEIAKNLKPSARGELEITDVNNKYLQQGQLRVKILGRGMAWLDTGTYEGLINAANFVEVIQKRQGQSIACIEEIAFRLGYITTEQLVKLAEPLLKTDYGKYLLNIVESIS